MVAIELTNFHDDENWVHAFWGAGEGSPSNYNLKVINKTTGATILDHSYGTGSSYYTVDIYMPKNNRYDVILRSSDRNSWWESIWDDYEPALKLEMPSSVTYNNTENSITVTGNSYYCGLEVEPLNTNIADAPYSQYSLDSRQYFYDICVNQSESIDYKLDEVFTWAVMERWTKPVVTVSCFFISGSTSNRSYIQQAINQINPIIAPSGVQLQLVGDSDSSADIPVTFGSGWELFGEPEDGFYYTNGMWSRDAPNGIVRKSPYTWVKLRTNPVNGTIASVALEEIAQVMGAGNDSHKYPVSIYFQHPYRAKPTTINTRDADVLRLLYNHGIPAGTSPWNVARLINTYFKVGDSFYLSGGTTTRFDMSGNRFNLKAGTQYRARAWQISNSTNYYGANYFSKRTNWLTVSPSLPAFEWTYPKNSGNNLTISAEEFTRLQQIINLKRQNRGLSYYYFTPVYPGDTANQPYLFNQLINAIYEMNTSIGSSGVTTGVTTFNDPNLFSRIKNAINAIN